MERLKSIKWSALPWGCAAAVLSLNALAADMGDGLDIVGYLRGGLTDTPSSGPPRGHYSLGMDGGMWRLGNEGDLDANIRIRNEILYHEEDARNDRNART